MYAIGDKIEYGNGQTAKVCRLNSATGHFALVRPDGFYAHCRLPLQRDGDDLWVFVEEGDPWIPQWRFEFGDFPVADMPAIPAGFEDCSYHNDMGPCFENEAAGWRLWVQWSDPSLREFEDTPRFSLCPNDDRVWEFNHTGFEEWDQVLDFLAKFPTLAAWLAFKPEGN